MPVAYQCGKARLGRRIFNIIKLIEKDLAQEHLPYFEPFVGAGGVMFHFASEQNNRELYACDANKDLILMWRALQKGWKPPLTTTKEEWLELKVAKPSPKRAFIGIFASYNTTFFNGYRLNYKQGSKRDFLREGYNGLLKMVPVMKKVDFMTACSYEKWAPDGYLIYADPPYAGNQIQSTFFDNFDSDAFWEKMRDWSQNNIVIISETRAPADFKKVWSAESSCKTRHGNKIYTDCLFMHKTLFDHLSKNVKSEISKI